MYWYPIKIQRQKKIIKEEFSEVLEWGRATLSIKKLRRLGVRNKFDISVNDNGRMVIFYDIEREETDEERYSRVKKEIAYMREYKKRNSK